MGHFSPDQRPLSGCIRTCSDWQAKIRRMLSQKAHGSFMWIMLYGIVFVAFLLIGVASSADGYRNFVILILFAIGFAAVLALITDLDRPQQGLFRVSQQAMLDLQRQIENFTP